MPLSAVARAHSHFMAGERLCEAIRAPSRPLTRRHTHDDKSVPDLAQSSVPPCLGQSVRWPTGVSVMLLLLFCYLINLIMLIKLIN